MVIALNKLGDAAIPVRRQWIRTTLLARKTPVKGGPTFVTKALVDDAHLITDYRLSEIAAELLGLSTGEKSHGGRDAVSTHLDGLGVNGDGRAQVVALGLVLAGLESRCPKDAWRSGGAGSSPWRNGLSNADYLAFLEANGYVLSDIEQVIVGSKKADDLYDEIANPAKEDAAEDD
jgi:ParB family chromosome partitioning protein